MDEKVNDSVAATKIQSVYRGHQTRKIVREQNEAASKIQSQFKKYKSRGSLLHTLCTTNPKYHYTQKEISEFEQNEKKQMAQKIKSTQTQKEQLQKQEECAMIIQRSFRTHLNRNESKTQKTATNIKTYRRVFKMKAKDIKALRVSGYNNERVTPINKLSEQFKQNKKGQIPRWYTSDEIATHNIRNDVWVVIFDKIYDITDLIAQNAENANTADLIRPLLKFAGQDISHWFDSYTNDVKTFMNPISNTCSYYLPHGRFVDVPPPIQPLTNWTFDLLNDDMPWWQNWKFVVGLKSAKPRNIRVVNTLTSQEKVLQVTKEETLNEIQKYRYLPTNQHSESYTWKYQSTTLDMSKTLEQNDIKDEDEMRQELRMYDEYIPSIYIYFNDDLTVA